MGNQIAKTRRSFQSTRELTFEDPPLSQDCEYFTVALGNVPPLIGQPMRPQGNRLLQTDEEIEHYDLPRGPIASECIE